MRLNFAYLWLGLSLSSLHWQNSWQLKRLGILPRGRRWKSSPKETSGYFLEHLKEKKKWKGNGRLQYWCPDRHTILLSSTLPILLCSCFPFQIHLVSDEDKEEGGSGGCHTAGSWSVRTFGTEMHGAREGTRCSAGWAFGVTMCC